MRKFHILCDSKSELPLDILVTPASTNDDTVAISLIKQFLNNYKDALKPTYYAMDSDYEFEYVYQDIINDFKDISIIPYNPRGSYAPPMGLDEDFNPICSAVYKLVYWGKDGDYLKFRCPYVLGKCNCHHGMNWSSSSNYDYTLKYNYKENPRHWGYHLRSSDLW